MREILFRGKRVDNGEFAYGYVGVFKGTTQIYVPFTEEEEKENEGHIFSVIGGLWHTVIPETVSQFTGLTDKNDKKIFEGDIVEHHIQGNILVNRGVVNWDEKSARWAYQLNTMNPCFALYNPSAFEVIGNIHDNPELLEVTDNAG